MEDNQLQLKQLPCVGQEVDVETYQSCSYKMIRSGMLKNYVQLLKRNIFRYNKKKFWKKVDENFVSIMELISLWILIQSHVLWLLIQCNAFLCFYFGPTAFLMTVRTSVFLFMVFNKLTSTGYPSTWCVLFCINLSFFFSMFLTSYCGTKVKSSGKMHFIVSRIFRIGNLWNKFQ